MRNTTKETNVFAKSLIARDQAEQTNKESSRFDHIPIGTELVLKKNEQNDKKKLKWSGDFKPVSTSQDFVDNIY